MNGTRERVRDPVIGIDLGTTNSALAWSAAGSGVRLLDVLQVVAAGETAALPILPSFLYLTDEGQRQSGAVRLPWQPSPDIVAGVFARDEGALVPARLVSSAKSWLSNARVDRTEPLLPWGTDAGRKISPVEASARVLGHLRDSWNHAHAGADGLRLEEQPVILTVPASFDEEARELTVQAARDAGLANVTLLEEPLAALYAWIAAHRRTLAAAFGGGALILVCDVGGGTTDFSLIRAAVDAADGELAFERIAIGEHLLLGGDNLDLALAVRLEAQLASPLSLAQRQTLRRKCTAAKERLLSDPSVDRVPITILGSGRGLVGGGMTVDLTREDVVGVLYDGFLPLTAPDDLPSRTRRLGLRELGLAYETEAAITRHLAAFLVRASDVPGTMARPDAVLFNGGFFAPAVARERVLDALASWLGARPRVLENAHPDAAVATGAAFYGRLRRDPGAARRLIIRAGSARSYYIGVHAEDALTAVSLAPRGTEEGTTLVLEREFTVTTNQAAAFTLYSSIDRSDPPGTIVHLRDEEVTRHSPLVTSLRFGKRSRRVPLQVRLRVVFTETGTLEIWCEAAGTGHRWRLAFSVRGVEAGPGDDEDEGPADTDDTGVVIAEEAVAQAVDLLTALFGEGRGSADTVTADVEAILGHGKASWPLGVIRRLADVLIAHAAGRTRGASFEARWLNLTGFCVRPGFGSAADPFRVSELRKVYVAGLSFPREVQNQVEWIVLWQRVAAGFSVGQQRELALRMTGLLGLGQRKAPRLNPQIEREAWRLLASLERLDAAQRTRLGDEVISRARREPRSATWLWCLGRLGAREPLYGPLNSVVPAEAAERWVTRLLEMKAFTADAAAAVTQIAARTDDPARDVSTTCADGAAARLESEGYETQAAAVRAAQGSARRDAGRIFGESLPEGLRLA